MGAEGVSLHVLVVEDEQKWSDILAEEFERHGCTVAHARSLAAAVKHLADNHFDIVTIDMWLTKEEKKLALKASSGWRLLLRQLQRRPDTQVFVVSYAFESDFKRGYEGDPQSAFELGALGVGDFLSKKNFDPHKIQEWVERVKRSKSSSGDESGGYPLG